VNRQIGVKDFKNVDHFCFPVIGHVTLRMRSDHSRWW